MLALNRFVYHKLIHFHGVDRGGHFAAWDQPELFVAELRAAFETLRELIERAARPARAACLNQPAKKD